MKKETIGIIILLLIVATIPVSAMTNSNTIIRTVTTPNDTGGWLHAGTATPSSSDYYLHYDDGSCETAVGWAKSDHMMLNEVIKLTPTELAGCNGAFDKIKVCHGYPGEPAGWVVPENYSAWMYTGVDIPLTPTTNTTLVASGFCDVINDWFYVNLTNPYPFTENDTVWVGFAWYAPIGTYPAAIDTDTCTQGKGDWAWLGEWAELPEAGVWGNWGLEVHTPESDTVPPVTTCTLYGTIPTTVFLTAYDNYSGVASTVYSLDGGPVINYTYPFQVREPSEHQLMFYSVDNAGNRETPQYQFFAIPYNITISIQGGFGVTATIHNNDGWTIDINGTMTVTGFVFPKEKPFHVTIPAEGDVQVSDKVLGFGMAGLSVTAANETITGKAFVFLFFVFPNFF